MNKNIILPLAIIIAATLIGGAVLFSGDSAPAEEDLAGASNLRALEVAVPGMFCAGCTASVEGYVSSVPGVKRVQARLVPEKSATVIYDPETVSKEEIIKNQVFDIYGVSIISDEPFSGDILPPKSRDGLVVPQDIQDRSRQVALLLKQRADEGKDVSTAQVLFNQINSGVEQGDFQNARALLDAVTYLLQNLQ